jgi:hypothetical protein
MARQRRSGGFKPPELRGTLGTLLRTTLQQAGVVKDAISDTLERGARQGRARLDDLRADRRRQEALAELGELVLELIRKGEIDLAELPEAQSIVDHLEELDAEEDAAEASPPRSVRQRFDDRGGDDDGTVSSTTWRPPNRRAGKPTQVWKPNVEAAGEPTPETNPGHKALPREARKGGIAFPADDDDDDLADYMHPDDVPSKKPD